MAIVFFGIILLLSTATSTSFSAGQATNISNNSTSPSTPQSSEEISISGIKPSLDIKKKIPQIFNKKIDDLINAGETRDYAVLIIVKKVPENGISAKSIAKQNKDLVTNALINNHNAKNVQKGKVLSFVTAHIPLQEIKKLAEYDYVVAIGDGERKLVQELDVSRPSVFADNLNFTVNGMPVDGNGVIVAEIDTTSVRQDHPDLPIGTKIVTQAICDDNGCSTMGPFTPTDDHATHVAGIIGGLGTINPDLNGIAPGSLLLASELSIGTANALAHAMDWSIVNGATIINISLGFPTVSGCPGNEPEELMVDEAVDEGAFVVKSAGNIGPNQGTITDPGCAFNVMAVGAMNDMDDTNRVNDSIWDDTSIGGQASSHGPSFDGRLKPEIVAPGRLINSPDLETDYESVTGTSFAAPHVSGSAALVKQMRPQYSPLEVKTALLLGAEWNPTNEVGVPETASEYENDGSLDSTLNTYGFGYLDVNQTLTYANTGNNIIKDQITQNRVSEYSFSANANEEVKVILSWLKHPGGTIINPTDVAVSNLDFTIKDSGGNEVIASDSTLQNNEFAVFNAPATDTYTIIVDAPNVVSPTSKETFALASTHVITKEDQFCDNKFLSELLASYPPSNIFDNRGGSSTTISGTNDDDLILAGDNGDTVRAKAGNDCIIGGAGDDTLKGDAGNDQIFGLGGNDNIDGGKDNDRLFGNDGNDDLNGGTNDDVLVGGIGNDTLNGHNGTDACTTDAEDTNPPSNCEILGQELVIEELIPAGAEDGYFGIAGSSCATGSFTARSEDGPILAMGPRLWDPNISATGCYRAWVSWDVSGIPNNAQIIDTVFKYESLGPETTAFPNGPKAGTIYSLENMPEVTDSNTLRADIRDGTQYVESDSSFDVIGVHTIDLGSLAVADLESDLAGGINWFGIGISHPDETTDIFKSMFMASSEGNEGTTPPTLIVTYVIP